MTFRLRPLEVGEGPEVYAERIGDLFGSDCVEIDGSSLLVTAATPQRVYRAMRQLNLPLVYVAKANEDG